MERASSTVSILQWWAKFSFDTPDWPNSAAFWCINYWNASLTYSMRFSLCGALLCATLDTNTLDGFTTLITNANHTSDSTHAHSMLCPFPSDFTEHPHCMFHVWFVIVHSVCPLSPASCPNHHFTHICSYILALVHRHVCYVSGKLFAWFPDANNDSKISKHLSFQNPLQLARCQTSRNQHFNRILGP